MTAERRGPGRPQVHGERVQVIVRLPVDLHARLASAAYDRDVSMTQITAKAIEKYLDSLVPLP